MNSVVNPATPTSSRKYWPLIALQMAIFFSLFGLNPASGTGGDGSALRQIAWILLVALSFLGVTAATTFGQHFKNFLFAKRTSLLLLGAFFTLALLSSLWSEAPFVTFKRAALLGIVFLIALFAVFTMEVNDASFAEIIVTPLAALLVISILFTAVFPQSAFTAIGWRGLAGHKNEMGQLASLLVLASFFLTAQNSAKHRRKAIFIALGLMALAISKSTTALMALLFTTSVLSIGYLLGHLNKHRTWIVPALLVASVILCITAIALLLDLIPAIADIKTELFSAMGKSENLTGRTKLWDLVSAQHIYRSEVFGGGYGGFWDISNERVSYVIRQLGFAPIQAHNGYLDVFNDLGYLGLALLSIIIIYFFRNLSLRLLSAAATINAIPKFYFALGIYIVISNFSESSLFRTTQFLNLLFVVAFIYSAGTSAAVNRQIKYSLPKLHNI